jgi:crossover junction endodeoxyribonuclease RuvC
MPFASRLSALGEELARVLETLEPSACAVESPFHGSNARSALQLAHARGVILSVLGRSGMSPVEYAPATVKMTVCGNGRADKEQVRAMVSRLTRQDPEALSHDVADAIAVALCHQAHVPVSGRG